MEQADGTTAAASSRSAQVRTDLVTEAPGCARDLDPMAAVMAELARDADGAVFQGASGVRCRMADNALTRKLMIEQIRNQAHSMARAHRLGGIIHRLGVLEKSFTLTSELNKYACPTTIGAIVSAIMQVGAAACRWASAAVLDRKENALANVEQEKLYQQDAQMTIDTQQQRISDEVGTIRDLVEFASTMDERVAEIVRRQARVSDITLGRNQW